MTERFTGHGAEWRDSDLTPSEAKIALRVISVASLFGPSRASEHRLTAGPWTDVQSRPGQL